MAEFSPTRTHATWKPRVTPVPVPYFRCSVCGAVLQGVDGDVEITMSDNHRSQVAELPYAHTDFHPECCGKPMERLEGISYLEVKDKLDLDYQIVGSYDHNALRVTWKVVEPGYEPRWFAIKTFTGVMTKYVTPKKWPPIVFAFADEDAYAYCDEDPCLECTFRCKRGMEVYCYTPKIGLIVMPLERMVATGSAGFDRVEVPKA